MLEIMWCCRLEVGLRSPVTAAAEKVIVLVLGLLVLRPSFCG